VSISRKIRSAPAIARRPWLYWLPMIVIGEKKMFAIRKNMIRSPACMRRGRRASRRTISRIATKNWLLSSSSGARIAEVRASAML
jgi:hypothetical protein